MGVMTVHISEEQITDIIFHDVMCQLIVERQVINLLAWSHCRTMSVVKWQNYPIILIYNKQGRGKSIMGNEIVMFKEKTAD